MVLRKILMELAKGARHLSSFQCQLVFYLFLRVNSLFLLLGQKLIIALRF